MPEEWSKLLKKRLSLPLPGTEAQYKMAHAERRINLSRFKVPDNPRKGAVMIMLYEFEGRICFPLIVRATYEGVHSGQVALPGGGFDEGDFNIQNTALRETREETGIEENKIEVLGALTELYIPPSNFLVQPFVSVYNGYPLFAPHEKEVERIIEVDIDKLLDEKLIGEKEIKMSSGITVVTPYFNIEGLVVWGATAMILSEFKSILFETGI